MAESTSVLKKISGSDYSTTNMEGPTPGLLVASSGSEEDRYLGNDEEDDGVVNSSSESDDLDSDDSDSDDDDDSEGEDEPSNNSASNQRDHGDGISDYEKLRLERIARNQARLAQLGLLDHNKSNAKKKTTGPKKRERRKSYEGPARAQPKRGAKSNKPNLYTADALDVRKLRLSHGGGGGGYKYKHSCGECAGCAREDDCNTCYYCVQRAENISYTRKCLFKQCRNKIKKQQGKTIKPTLITNDDGSFNIEDADKDNTNAEETDGKNAAGEDKEKENLTVDNTPDAVNSGNTADEKNSDEEKPTAKNIRHQHCDICEAPAKDDLIECGNCDRGFHSNCHFPKIKTLFHPGDFLCMDCNPRALVAVMDRKVIKVKLIEPAPPCMACHGDCPQTAPDESILCKACDNYIHLDCHDPPLDSKPRGGAARWWRCSSCAANNVPVLPQYQGNLGRPSGKASGPKQSKPKKLNPNLKLFEGEHDDDCYICYNGGELVCCDFCSKAFHCACHIPALPKIPSGIWKCCECYASERTRKTRCGECEACMAEDCGTCHYCLDRPKFGGFNKLKKPCVKRNCPFQSFAEMAQPGKIPGQLDVVALTPSKRGRPPKKESKKRPLTSDTDSSSILEIATNKPKRMKIADSSSEPPNVSKKRSRIYEADPSSSQGFTTTNNINNKQMTAIAVIEPYKGPPLVEEKDRPLISDFLYLTLEQMRPTKLRLDDQTGCYRLQAVGSPGLACRHCYDEGVASNGRYFPASETSLSQSTTSKTIVGHVQRCHRCPIEVRERIESMQLARMGPGGKKTCAKIGPNGTPGEEKPKHGGRKLFFNRLWDRIQGLGAEVEDSISYIKFEALEVKENLQVDDNATNTSIDETSILIFKVPKPTDTASIKVRKLIKGAYKNPDDSKVQDKAIEHLRKFATSSEDIDKIILAGGIEMMARAMQQHPDKSIVQAEACCTVGEMAWIQPQLANKLAHSGILNFIVSAMDHHQNNMKVQQMGCGAFRALSYDGANVQVINDADGPAAVLKAMKNNPNKLLVQREGCFFLQNMLSCSGDVSAVVNKVMEAGVVAILLEAMSSDVADSDADLKQSVATLLSNLSLNAVVRQSIGSKTGAISILIATLMTCTELECAQAICYALKHLAIECPENQARIFDKDGLSAIFQAMKTFHDDPAILVTSFGLLKELSAHEDVTYASGIVDGGGLPIILSAMMEHSYHTGVQIAACDVIAYLPYGKKDKMAPKIAASVISSLEIHPDAVDVQMAGCEALLEIATHVPAACKLTKCKKTSQLLQNAKELDARCASDVDDILAL